MCDTYSQGVKADWCTFNWTKYLLETDKIKDKLESVLQTLANFLTSTQSLIFFVNDLFQLT